MQPDRPVKTLHLLILLLAAILCPSASALADPPLPLDLDDSRNALAIGEELERSGSWLEAVQHYDRALKRWPEDGDLKYGHRRARVQFRIERRYTDRSFRNAVRRMTQRESLELLDSLTQRIRGSFVDSLSHLSLVAHGTESLYIALANPKFLEANLPAARSDAERKSRKESIKALRRILREQYWNKPIHSGSHARSVVVEVVRHADRELRLNAVPVIFEYIFGSCNSLDDYSGFLTADRLADLYGNIDGEFVGLGVEMKGEAGKGMLMVSVLPESPAETGGLRRGDHIIEIDGTDVRDESIDEAASMLRGTVGSRVRLKVVRDTPQREWEVVLVRRAVQIKSIPKAEIIDRENGIGYIHLAGFQKSTSKELDAALDKLERQNMKALVLDVRGNPGGLLTAAVEVLDRFIEEGVLVSTKGRTGDQNWTYRAHRERTLDVPLVLLTDGDSASASEIVAGAIRDHRRGQIVGRKTFGKWSVQSIFNVGRENGLRLTTAKFYSPNGHTHGKVGVKPNVPVEVTGKEYAVGFRGLADDEKSDADIDEAVRILSRKLNGFRSASF